MDAATKARILVVEDEKVIRQVLCFFLSHNGFETLGVSSGEEAIHIIPEFNPHLLLLDLVMHPVSGWDVLNWLRSNYTASLLPVVVLSSLVNLKEQIHGFEEGAVDYITKPTQPTVIVERIRTILAMSIEQRTLLQRKRLAEQRETLTRLYAAQQDAFVY